jgi:hypothetical protein
MPRPLAVELMSGDESSEIFSVGMAELGNRP